MLEVVDDMNADALGVMKARSSFDARQSLCL